MKKQRKFKLHDVFSYCENLKRHLTYEEFWKLAKDQKAFDVQLAEVGSVSWLFKKGLGVMDLWQYIDRLRKAKTMKDLYKIWKEQGRDPKKKLMYDEYLMRDITLEEWGQFQLNLRSYAGEMQKVAPQKVKYDKKYIVALCNFFEETGGKPASVKVRDGWYEGLWDHFDDVKLDLTEISLIHINEAWKLYRRHHPVAPPKPLEDAKVLDRGKKRDKLFGHPITAVIRTMGKEGFDFKMCRKVLDRLEAEASDNTIRAQLRYARIDFKEPAQLTEKQMDLLWENS